MANKANFIITTWAKNKPQMPSVVGGCVRQVVTFLSKSPLPLYCYLSSPALCTLRIWAARWPPGLGLGVLGWRAIKPPRPSFAHHSLHLLPSTSPVGGGGLSLSLVPYSLTSLHIGEGDLQRPPTSSK
jgi:hypothetical protein